MDSEEMKFVEEEIAELRARAEHYRVLHEKLLRHCDEIDRLHKNEIRSLAGAIEGMQERIAAIQERWEYEKMRADANWKALCECNGDAA